MARIVEQTSPRLLIGDAPDAVPGLAHVEPERSLLPEAGPR